MKWMSIIPTVPGFYWFFKPGEPVTIAAFFAFKDDRRLSFGEGGLTFAWFICGVGDHLDEDDLVRLVTEEGCHFSAEPIAPPEAPTNLEGQPR